MPSKQLDRTTLRFKSLTERADRVQIESDCVLPEAMPERLDDRARSHVDETVQRIVAARDSGKARMLVFGAHTIKNGLSPVIIRLIERGWLTHLATNGAGIIHDWEFAYQGTSSEHVAQNVDRGEFGMWEETGYFLNLAIVVGAYRGLGYGESVGAMVEFEGLDLPSVQALHAAMRLEAGGNPDNAGAAADLLQKMLQFKLNEGWLKIEHPYKKYGLQAAALRHGIPFTSHPMIGHDIIYLHPMNSCAAIGRTAERDFLSFAQSVTGLNGGVYMSIGSAVMSPMIFEKSVSMAQNLAIQRGEHLDNHFMTIVDLQASHWDWQKGEPPEDNPDYYLRYNKSFSRMGGTMRYLCADNRDFLLALLHGLEGTD
jgi:hypothetical protein